MDKVFAQLLPKEQRRPLEYDEVSLIGDILNAAELFMAGKMSMYDFGSLGEGHRERPAAYWRFMAVLSTPREDSRRWLLLDAIDEILKYQGLVLHRGGIMDKAQVWDIARTREMLLSDAVEVQ